MKQTNLELERRDGIRRHFRFDWEEVAFHNADYRAYVEVERDRLGEDHPLFLTQYRLLPIRGGGGFLSAQQRSQLQGSHSRRHAPAPRTVYVAGIDIAGEAEGREDALWTAARPKQDSTVLTIGELDYTSGDDAAGQPRIRVVEHYWCTAKQPGSPPRSSHA